MNKKRRDDEIFRLEEDIANWEAEPLPDNSMSASYGYSSSGGYGYSDRSQGEPPRIQRAGTRLHLLKQDRYYDLD